MKTETFSYKELETKLLEGWKLVKENKIGNRIFTVVMEKEGDKFEFIDSETKAKEEYIKSLSPVERKRYNEYDKLKKRGYDI